MIQDELWSIIVITLVLCTLFYSLGKRLDKLKTEEVPKGFLLSIVLYVESMYKLTISNMGEKYGKMLAGYIGAIFIYIFIANVSGLVGLTPPTSNLSVTIALAFITWILIQYAKIKTKGWKGFIKGFFEPFAPFVIPNIFSFFAPLISLSIRLFGNILAGSIIMGLLYTFTAWLSGMIPVIGGLNIVSLLITPFLHMYFDIFAGFLQAFLFISLTTIFIAVETQD